MKRTLSLIALGMVGISLAHAEPASYVDLGDFSQGSHSGSSPIALPAANAIAWFKVKLPQVTTTLGFVDLWINGPGDMSATEMGLYGSTGDWIRDDGADGPGNASALSFGRLTGNRPAQSGIGPFANHGVGLPFNGRDGELAGGDYWIAVGRLNATFFTSNWNVTDSYAGTERTTTFLYSTFIDPPPSNPIGIVEFNSNTVRPGTSVLARITVTPAGNPTSTGITATVDATSVGAGVLTLHDDGQLEDSVANDLVFSKSIAINSAIAPGNYTLPFTISDAEGRGSTTTGILSIVPVNDFCFQPTDVGLGSYPFDTRYATTDGSINCIAGPMVHDVWFRFTPPADGAYVFDTCGSNGVISVLNSCSGPSVGCADHGCSGGGAKLQLDTLVGGFPYLVRVSGVQQGTLFVGPGTLTISHATPLPPTATCGQWDGSNWVGTNAKFWVQAVSGTLPPSTGFTVSADFSQIGGSATEVFYDDATHGDTVAGDNYFVTTVALPATLLDGTYVCPFTARDAQGRSATGNFNVKVVAPAHWIEPTDLAHDAGSYPATAQFPQGDGPLPDIQAQLFHTGGNGSEKIDMFAIRICDVQNFTATTNHPVTNLNRTILYLFDQNGNGVQMNDNDPVWSEMSWMDHSFVTHPGLYYIAVAAEGPYPINSALERIWWNQPQTSVNPPTAPSGNYRLNYWQNESGSGGNFTYRLKMTGVCFPCRADMTRDGEVDFFDYLEFVDAYSASNAAADFNHDGGIDFFDYLDFVDAFASGC